MVLVAVISLAIPMALAIGFQRWSRGTPAIRPLLPGVLITATGIELAIATYLWIAEVPEACTGRDDFACVVNGNQGLLGLLALIVGAAGLWITALFRLSDRKQEAVEREKEVAQILENTLEETVHNLIHVGGAFDDDQHLRVMPQFSRHCLTALLDTHIRPHIDVDVAQAADAMDRNLDRLDALEWNDDFHDKAPWALRSYVGRAIRLLLVARLRHPDWASSILKRPGLQDLEEVAKEGHFQHSFYSSGAKSDEANLRTLNRPLICWWVDESLDRRVKVYEQGVRFKDLARGHSH
jgi:hypothetical protein